MVDTSGLNSTTSVNTGGLAIFAGVWLIVWLVIAVVLIVAMWKVFTKAGKPGWAAIIPIYNVIVELEIVGRPLWWVILFLIPFVNIVVAIIVSIDLAKSFGKSALFGVVGLVLFSIIGWLMLGFGDSKYIGPSASGAAPTPKAPTPPATPAAPTATPPSA